MLKQTEDPERPVVAPVGPSAKAYSELRRIIGPGNILQVIHIAGGEILYAELFVPVAHCQATFLPQVEFKFTGQTMPFVYYVWQVLYCKCMSRPFVSKYKPMHSQGYCFHRGFFPSVENWELSFGGISNNY
jgi:hypothetical protein